MSVIRFLMVGGIGFLVDASVFAMVTQWAGGSWAVGRACAFLAAVGATWQGNRRWTFASSGELAPEAARYACVQVTGCLLNYFTFSVALHASPTAWGWIPAYLLGCSVASAFNYFMSRKMVFRRTTPDTATASS